MGEESPKPTTADLQSDLKKKVTPFDEMRRKALGPRVNAAVQSRLNLYVSLAALFVALQSTCVSRGWLNWVKKNNSRPLTVYVDPSGTGTLIDPFPPGQEPAAAEFHVKAALWSVCRMQFNVMADVIGVNEQSLTDFFYTPAGQQQQQRESANEKVFGSSAEKLAVVADNKTREIELRNIVWVTPATKTGDSYSAVAEVFIYARTFNGAVAEKKRAYRVTYNISFSGPNIPGDTPAAQKLFLYNNSVRLRVDRWHVEEENAGIIPDQAGNNGPDEGPQAKALGSTGAWPDPAVAKTGGPVAVPFNPAPAEPKQTNPNPNRGDR